MPQLETAIQKFIVTEVGWEEPWVTVNGKPKRFGIDQGEERMLMMVLLQ